MPQESLMKLLIEGAIQVHGPLDEVVFLEKNKNSLLVFRDGTVLPTSHDGRGTERFQAIAHEVNSYGYLDSIAAALGGQFPLSLLAFGYSGTGPTNFAALLSAAGFQRPEVRDITPPVRLLPDGSQVRGTRRNERVEWEDGSVTRDPDASARKESTEQQSLSKNRAGGRPHATEKKKWWQFWK